jgi:hypothetical protein
MPAAHYRFVFSLLRTACFLLIAAFIAPAPPASAIIIINGSEGRNLTAPTGAYANSGWQYLGDWGGVMGTPVSPHFFLSAKHAGFAGDGLLHSNTGDYSVINAFYDPNSDLALYQVAETFTDFAPLYTGSSETTLGEAVLYGRGTDRGTALLVNGTQKGWNWGTADFQRSWGTNAVSEIVDFGPSLGDLLVFTNDTENGQANEGAVSGWDSGGPVFVNENGTWKLAGINYGVETYSLDGVNGLSATVWDTRGLYVSNGSGYDFIPSSLTTPQPGIFGSTRISSRYESFLLPIIRADLAATAPEPGALALLLPIIAAGAVRFRRRRR